MHAYRLVRLILVTLVLLALGGCSSLSDGTGGTSGTSGTSGTTGGGVAFRGTLTAKGESGVVDATLPSGTKTASVNPLAGEAAGATNTVVATDPAPFGPVYVPLSVEPVSVPVSV